MKYTHFSVNALGRAFVRSVPQSQLFNTVYYKTMTNTVYYKTMTIAHVVKHTEIEDTFLDPRAILVKYLGLK